MPAKNDAKFSVRVPRDMAERLRRAAETDQRSTGSMLRVLVTEALTARERGSQSR